MSKITQLHSCLLPTLQWDPLNYGGIGYPVGLVNLNSSNSKVTGGGFSKQDSNHICSRDCDFGNSSRAEWSLMQEEKRAWFEFLQSEEGKKYRFNPLGNKEALEIAQYITG